MPSLDTAASGLDGPTLSSALSFVARGSQACLAVQENVRRQPDSLWDWPTHRSFRRPQPAHLNCSSLQTFCKCYLRYLARSGFSIFLYQQLKYFLENSQYYFKAGYGDIISRNRAYKILPRNDARLVLLILIKHYTHLLNSRV